jgi:ABC-type transporter Mla MlaB component
MSKRPRNATATSNATTLALPAECLIGNAASLRESLLGVAANDEVTLDAGAVQRIDTACLQILAAFVRERDAAQHPVKWSAVPDALTERARLLDLDELLALAAPADAA